mmetsp:Transcript_28658/g.66068  ORF Transcript_28658/g.66068 Transcript_28658/m.66068 type:complete len:605 (+) Transcript_28658:92-1906(+)
MGGTDISGAMLALPGIFDSLGKVMEVKDVLGAALEAIKENSKAIEDQRGSLAQVNEALEKHAQLHADFGTRLGAHEGKLEAASTASKQKLAEAEEGQSARIAALESRFESEIKKSLADLSAQVAELKGSNDKLTEMQGRFVMTADLTKELDAVRAQIVDAGKDLGDLQASLTPLGERVSSLEQEQIDNNVAQRLSLLEDEVLLHIKVEISSLKEELASIPAMPLGFQGSSAASSPPQSAPAGDFSKPLTPPPPAAITARSSTESLGTPAAALASAQTPPQTAAQASTPPPPSPGRLSRQQSPASLVRPPSQPAAGAAAAAAAGSEGKAKASRMPAPAGQKSSQRKGKDAAGGSVASVLLMEGDTRWVGKEDFERMLSSVEKRVQGALNNMTEVEERIEAKVSETKEKLDARMDALSQRQEAVGQQLQARQDARFVTVMDTMQQQLNGLKANLDENSQAVQVEMDAAKEARQGEAVAIQEEQAMLASEIKRIEAQFSSCTTNCLACGASPRPVQPERTIVGNDGAQYGGTASPTIVGRNDIGAPVQQFLSREWEWETARTPLRKGGGFTTSTAHFYDGTRPADTHSRSAQSLGLQIVHDTRKTRT